MCCDLELFRCSGNAAMAGVVERLACLVGERRAVELRDIAVRAIIHTGDRLLPADSPRAQHPQQQQHGNSSDPSGGGDSGKSGQCGGFGGDNGGGGEGYSGPFEEVEELVVEGAGHVGVKRATPDDPDDGQAGSRARYAAVFACCSHDPPHCMAVIDAALDPF